MGPMMVTVSRLYYFKLMTRREPSDLERLQNTGNITIPAQQLFDLQKHKRPDENSPS